MADGVTRYVQAVIRVEGATSDEEAIDAALELDELSQSRWVNRNGRPERVAAAVVVLTAFDVEVEPMLAALADERRPVVALGDVLAVAR